MEIEGSIQQVRVVPDAVVGAGKVFISGQVVNAHLFGPHLAPLLEKGALVWVPNPEHDSATWEI